MDRALEYSTEVFNPTTKRLVQRLERPQRFFTRIALKKCGIKNKTYRERLKIFGLDTLELRRCKQDLITTYKIENGLVNIPKEKFFTLPYRDSSRTHHHKFFKKRVSGSSKGWFANRIINPWNSLPAELDLMTSMVAFKALLSSMKEIELIPKTML